MKTYRRIILLIAALLGIIGLILMASFTTYNACEFANTNNVYIKNQTELAFDAGDFKMVKYYAYKALTGIERAKDNFKDCGCDMATKSIDRTKENLKSATKAPTMEDAKTFVKIALKNTHLSIAALEDYEPTMNSAYGEGFLTMNTNSKALITDDIVNFEGNTLSEKIESGIAKFKSSLDRMIEINDCATALNYVQVTHELSVRKSADQTISPGKRYYHKRIKEVTANALKDLENCK
ncbi:hypothetical protein MTsPCn9_00290 [Croceitalea sp. MTPC9]|uniref:hypothetical protein n=1 Tax=unclassified Croceitalea TaxID=2632280 RepID=UPI002B3B4630|nr:hypothetical protein MTsPCn6_08420 [Croceitalea sp. MTPC6]GMN15093.1 hypothetical protein MTsPCn9_00290 [Croceitalea sp. MTPC9]